MDKNKQPQYEIISLGYACMTRTFLTQDNLIPSKANGRKSMIFDLMPNPTCVITQCIKNNFEDYFDDIQFEYHPLNRQNYWHNKKYDVYYVHDRDCKNNFNKFKKRYEKRIDNFKKALNNSTYTYFVHIPKSTENGNIDEDINNLYMQIKNIRGDKPFRLIIWDILDEVKDINSEITVIKDIHPQKNDDDWWNPQSWTEETLKWKQNLLDDTKKEIEKDSFTVKYYKNRLHKKSFISAILDNKKLISFVQNIFKVENDHDNNRKVMTLFGITFTLKKLHNFNYSDVIIRFDGRMGNQMFQWAMGRAYEAKNGIMPIFDDSYETLKLQPFGLINKIKTVPKPLWNKVLRKIIPIRNLRNKLTEIKFALPVTQEDNYYEYEEKFLTTQPPAYFRGYFQCDKYYRDIRQTLLEDFKLIKPLNKQNQQILEKIKNTNSISLHIRRCDYLKSSRWGVLDLNYYKNAVQIIQNQTDEMPTLFIFSDDINWVKTNMKFEQETVYVDVNSGKQGYFDLELMKNCKHNIIANSSFSWWGGWLNENPNKIVIAPRPWRPFMKSTDEEYNLLPQEWQRCDAWKQA